MLAQLPAEIVSPASPAFNNGFIGPLVSRTLTYAIALSGLFFFVKLVFAGFTYLTNQGDQAKINTASQTIFHAVVGLVLVISAFFIAQIASFVTGIDFGLI